LGFCEQTFGLFYFFSCIHRIYDQHKKTSKCHFFLWLPWVSFAISILVLSWTLILSFHPKGSKGNCKERETQAVQSSFICCFGGFYQSFCYNFTATCNPIPQWILKGLSLHILLSIASLFLLLDLDTYSIYLEITPMVLWVRKIWNNNIDSEAGD